MPALTPAKTVVGFDGGFEAEQPPGWSVKQSAEGQWQFTDPAEDALFEISTMLLPPLSSDAPTLQERVETVLRGTPGEPFGAIQTLEHNGLQLAWGSYHFDSHDTKQPAGAATRPAVGCVLLCANEWEQALMTGVWWTADTAWAEPAWAALRDSLRYERTHGGELQNRSS